MHCEQLLTMAASGCFISGNYSIYITTSHGNLWYLTNERKHEAVYLTQPHKNMSTTLFIFTVMHCFKKVVLSLQQYLCPFLLKFHNFWKNGTWWLLIIYKLTCRLACSGQFIAMVADNTLHFKQWMTARPTWWTGVQIMYQWIFVDH